MRPKKIKLVLTGGGTRGIYQIGVLKALAEHGILDQVTSVSGCSIGSLNMALMEHSTPSA